MEFCESMSRREASSPLLLDGGFGTMAQAAGLPAGKDPCDWNVERPEAVTAIHRAYVEAGADVVLTNTFGANRLKYHGEHALETLIPAAVANARASGAAKVALDLGPTGKLLKPAGDLDFDAAYDAFAEAIRLATAPNGGIGDAALPRHGGRGAFPMRPQNVLPSTPDLVFIETMGDVREVKAAVLAAKETCDLPVFVTVALGENGKLLTGGSVECVAALLESLDVAAYGFNCGLGPDRMLPFVERLAKVSTKPVIVKPNAGMPKLVDGQTVFPETPDEFAAHVAALVRAGASVVGGCCGTTPAHVQAVASSTFPPFHLSTFPPFHFSTSPSTLVSSGTDAVTLRPHQGLVIGERINPTGKKLLKEAYAKGDVAYILREAVKQVDAGAEILDVNCGVPGLDEAALIEATVQNVQSVATCPIQIDTADPAALERALRHVNGKPLVNSVNGKRASMDAVFPLVRKYGGALVGLCLDEDGIPATSDGRLAIARRILAEGATYGFTKDDFVFDALTLAVSADPQAAVVTLETVRRLTDELGVNTVLGVSNVSFGLPNRPALNNAMFALAKKAGLSAAIANPSLIRDEIDPAAADVLLARDRNCERWIALQTAANAGVGGAGDRGLSPLPSGTTDSGDPLAALGAAIRTGLRDDAAAAAKAALKSGAETMALVNGGIVPALEVVGKGFEAGQVYLPQLLMAADAAGEAFAVVKAAMAAKGDSAKGGAARRPIVIATVKGDIHDIGKNIVRALLENYGFDVIDLGRDVPPERIVEAARTSGAMLVGLSALMTTTVGAMAETIRLLKAAGLDCKTVVGGAVVTQEFADSIGADFYGGDAMKTVRIAERLAEEVSRREGNPRDAHHVS